jgi:predicted N-acetyltransferase YhbS
MTNLRRILPDDWPAIDCVQRAAFPPSAIESMEALQSIATLAPELCFVAESEGAVAGYVLAHPWIAEDLPRLNEPLKGCPPNADTLFIHDTALLPEMRGCGLARRMVEHLLLAARNAGLKRGSLLSVQGTVEFWKRFGFEARPELTERFRGRVFEFYEIDFTFMTATLAWKP